MADHVTEEAGTGFVHTAPGHGEDDFGVFLMHKETFEAAGTPEVPHTVREDGVYYDHVPLFAGKTVIKPDGKEGDANGAVIRELIERGKLLAKGKLRHQYPHSWRSKAPVIFRNTRQWFVSMAWDKADGAGGKPLRQVALDEIDRVRFYPPRARNRIRSMVENRPDWVLSRQRAWGVPITLFVHKQTRELLRDPEVNARIETAIAENGADVWFDTDPQKFLGNAYRADDYEQVVDILDVWFDSGATHAFTLEGRQDLKWPADLYLEGSDQHRGWFQSSLLESCVTRGRAPYDAILSCGFVLDKTGAKCRSPSAMSSRRKTSPIKTAPISFGSGSPVPISPKTCALARKSSKAWRMPTVSCATRCAFFWARWKGFPKPSGSALKTWRPAPKRGRT